jgi:ABC-2 type transport system permease protein
MSIRVFLSNVKLNRWGILAWSVIIFIYAIFVMYLFPIVSESSLNIVGYIESMPEAIKAAFGFEEVDIGKMGLTPESFAAIELFAFWPLLIGIYGIFVGVGIAREAEQGTLDLLLAQPVQRYKVIAAKFAVFVFSAVLISVFSVLGIIAGAATIDTPVDLASVSLVFVEAFLLVLSIGAVTLLCAAAFLKPRQALMTAGMFMGLSYILNFIVPALPEAFAWLRNLSVFYHFQAYDIVTSTALNGTSVIIYIVLSAVCFIAALVVFQRRDLVA